jgi:hypothetical protein
MTQENLAGEVRLPVPYSLTAVKALHSYWNIPYNYIPRCKSLETVDMSFSPVKSDSAWKGKFAFILLGLEGYNVIQMTSKH